MSVSTVLKWLRRSAVKRWMARVAPTFPWSLFYMFSRPEPETHFELIFTDREAWLDREIAECLANPKKYEAKTYFGRKKWRFTKLPLTMSVREFAPWDRKGRRDT